MSQNQFHAQVEALEDAGVPFAQAVQIVAQSETAREI